MRSTAILPVQNKIRFTSDGSGDAGSDSTSSNEPSDRSARALRAIGWRSSDFGVNTTSGFGAGMYICRRNRWKYWAGSVG